MWKLRGFLFQKSSQGEEKAENILKSSTGAVWPVTVSCVKGAR